MLWLWVDQTLQRQSSVDLTSLLLISTPLKSFNCPVWRRERDCCLPSTMSYTHRTPPPKDSTPSWVAEHNHNMNCLSSHPSSFVCNFVEANLNLFSFPQKKGLVHTMLRNSQRLWCPWPSQNLLLKLAASTWTDAHSNSGRASFFSVECKMKCNHKSIPKRN